MTFWFPNVGPLLIEVPKGDHLWQGPLGKQVFLCFVVVVVVFSGKMQIRRVLSLVLHNGSQTNERCP